MPSSAEGSAEAEEEQIGAELRARREQTGAATLVGGGQWRQTTCLATHAPRRVGSNSGTRDRPAEANCNTRTPARGTRDASSALPGSLSTGWPPDRTNSRSNPIDQPPRACTSIFIGHRAIADSLLTPHAHRLGDETFDAPRRLATSRRPVHDHNTW